MSQAADPLIVPEHGVMGTLLIPVWARAEETLRSDGIIRDPHAVRVLAASGYDTSRLAASWMVQTGIAVRTWLLDRMVAHHLAAWPTATVVNLGCGLDARCYRLDDGLAQWLDIDLEPVIAVRRQAFAPAPRHEILACSATDHRWMDAVPPGPAPLFLAEGLLMYLEPDDVRALIVAMAERFPRARFLFEMTGRSRVAASRRNHVVKNFGAAFAWGCDDPQEIVGWSSRLSVIENESYLSHFPRRWRWLRLLHFLPARRRFARIVGLRFDT